MFKLNLFSFVIWLCLWFRLNNVLFVLSFLFLPFTYMYLYWYASNFPQSYLCPNPCCTKKPNIKKFVHFTYVYICPCLFNNLFCAALQVQLPSPSSWPLPPPLKKKHQQQEHPNKNRKTFSQYVALWTFALSRGEWFFLFSFLLPIFMLIV